MSTTIVTPRQAVRQPYFRPLAGRTAVWTTVLLTALAGGQFAALTLGLAGVAGLVVGGAVALALGVTAYAATAGRQRWAQITVAAVWAAWVVVGYLNRGLHGSTLPLVEAVVRVALVVAAVLAMYDMSLRLRQWGRAVNR